MTSCGVTSSRLFASSLTLMTFNCDVITTAVINSRIIANPNSCISELQSVVELSVCPVRVKIQKCCVASLVMVLLHVTLRHIYT